MWKPVNVKSTHGTNHAIANRNDLNEWRCLKKVLDGAAEDAERHMTDAFGCHGEPIANAISEALWGLSELLPEGSEAKLNAYALKAFQAIGDHMTDVRSDLDAAVERAVNTAKEEGFEEAKGNLPSGYDISASDYGVDLDTTLEDAFEKGVDAISGYLDDVYVESVSFSMDDL